MMSMFPAHSEAEAFAKEYAGQVVWREYWNGKVAEGVVLGWIPESDTLAYVVVRAPYVETRYSIGEMENLVRNQVRFTVSQISDSGQRLFTGWGASALKLKEVKPKLNMAAYPHICHCGASAYMGAVPTALECSSPTCRHYKPVWL